jgi:hypothetical protein
MTGLGLGPLTAGLFDEYVAMPLHSVFWVYLGICAVALAALESALFAKALWLFVVGTLAGGVAVGFIFRDGLSELNRLAQPQHRAAVVSTFFVAAYVGLGLPAVLTGLISLPLGPVDASAWVSGLAAAAVALAFLVVLRSFGTAAAPRAAADQARRLEEELKRDLRSS